jgi:hypothetical protein
VQEAATGILPLRVVQPHQPRRAIMHIMFNNPLVYVVEYAGLEAVEVIDKRIGRGALIRDDAARRFREELKELVDHDEEVGPEAFDAFMGPWEALLTQPAIYH